MRRHFVWYCSSLGRGREDSIDEVTFENSLTIGVGVPRVTRGEDRREYMWRYRGEGTGHLHGAGRRMCEGGAGGRWRSHLPLPSQLGSACCPCLNVRWVCGEWGGWPKAYNQRETHFETIRAMTQILKFQACGAGGQLGWLTELLRGSRGVSAE